MTSKPQTVACPNCGTQSGGKFCAECGAALLGVQCAACQTLLTPGARFCHNCGTPAGAFAQPARVGATGSRGVAPEQSRSLLPWAVGLVAMLAVVIVVAVQRSGTTPQTEVQNIPLDGGASSAPPFAGGASGDPGGASNGAVRAPDISAMSPRERADRLYDRVMRQASEGKTDSAAFFATMAAQAYEMLGPLDDDLKYDYGRMAEMSGNLALAQKQSDAILASSPTHLLGLILGARVAQLENNAAARKRYNTKLLAVEASERAKNVEEYTRHKGDIDAAIAEAKSGR